MYVVSSSSSELHFDQAGDNFVGEVLLSPLLSSDGVRVASACFPPAGRTYWHRHEDGQLLHVTAGWGWVCSRGSDPVAIREGDVIWTAPGEEHWHGAAEDSVMVHLAVSLGVTQWSDEAPSLDGLRHSSFPKPTESERG